MKKRIIDSEIDFAKNANKKLFVLCFMFLLVIGFGVLTLYIYKDRILKLDKSSEVLEDSKEISVSNEGIDIDREVVPTYKINKDDSNVLRLFNIVKISDNTCDGYNMQKSVLVSDLSEKCRFSLIEHLYEKDVVFNGKSSYVSESDVRDAYEFLYGGGAYKSVEAIPYYNVTLNYNASNGTYFTEKRVEDLNNGMISYEKVIDAYKKGDSLFIDSVALYYESSNKIFCSDARCEEIVEKANNEPTYPDYYELYVDSRSDKLNKYTYEFKLNDAGFYNYVGYEMKK